MASKKLSFDDSSVQYYLSDLSSRISRMASNSANCKTLCITIISAIVFLQKGLNESQAFLITSLPIILFYYLDSAYLACEKMFRDDTKQFIKKLKSNEATISDLYPYIGSFIKRKGKRLQYFKKSLKSWSTFPFYLILVIITIIILSL